MAMAQFASVPAFPGAEGYGRYTTGGRGGAVYHVTSLDDNAEDPQDGTLRYFITKKNGPRTIVFDVAGNIELQADLKIGKGDLSILGQTAPGGGICLKNYPLKINASNVIIRFIRCRLGDVVDDDAMSASHHDDAVCKNIIIDHCSLSWCTDEVGSFYGNEDFTLQWSILSESLNDNAAKGTKHGFGGIWGGKKATFHHNLLAHNKSRMPRFDHDYVSTLKGPVDMVNCVVYNWGDNSTYGGESCNSTGEFKTFNMINNYYKAGPATASSKKNRLLDLTDACDNCTGGTLVPGHFYLSGNVMNGNPASANSQFVNNYMVKCFSNDKFVDEAWNATYGTYSTVSTHSAATAFEKVVNWAGASLTRDAIDTRVAAETKNGTSSTKGSNGSTNGIIDAVADAGGWPSLTGTPLADSDGDGMPDEWEIAHGLNPNVSNANKYNLDSKRYYTNIEVYANSLVEHIVKDELAGAEGAFDEYYPDMQNGEDEANHIYGPSAKDVAPTKVDGCSAFEFEDYSKVVLTGNSSKSYSAVGPISYNGGSYPGIKLSNGAQNTFYAPEGKFITTLTIIAHINGSGTRPTYWREVDGKIYADVTTNEANNIVYTPNASSNPFDTNDKTNPAVRTYEIGGKPSVTFTNAGEQVCFILDVKYGAASGIEEMTVDSPARKAVYNILGQRVNDSTKGLVIKNGCKYVNK